MGLLYMMDGIGYVYEVYVVYILIDRLLNELIDWSVTPPPLSDSLLIATDTKFRHIYK